MSCISTRHACKFFGLLPEKKQLSEKHLKLKTTLNDQESMDCKENSDCMMDRGYCHPSSKMCLCKNEASTYPACTIQEGDVCDPQCKEEEFCDLKTKKCMCSLGGFTLNCNTMVCPEFQVQRGIKCSCMYWEENGKCSKCKDECGSNEECRNQG